jgi:hypothetical protein
MKPPRGNIDLQGQFAPSSWMICKQKIHPKLCKQLVQMCDFQLFTPFMTKKGLF